MQVINEQTFNLISTNAVGALNNGICSNPFFSPNGRYVAFFSEAIDYQNEEPTGNFQLVIKDLITQDIITPNTGNGVCEHIHPTYENSKLRIASFSPDSTKIAFYSNSTNLIPSDNTLVQINPSSDYRWYVYDLTNDTISRVAYNNTVYGNFSDFNELLWKNNNEIVFVSYANNLVAGVNTDYHREVYLKNLTTNNIILVSRKEDTNILPFLTYNSFNIDVNDATDKVSFFSQELGFCIKNLTDSSLTRVQDLPNISIHGIVLATFFSFNLDGTKSLFKIEQGNLTFPYDINSKTDEFIYDFSTSDIIVLNDTGSSTGSGASEKAKFSPNGLKVAFICDSVDIDLSVTNDIKNLYIKEISSGILTRVSIPLGGGNLANDVIDYCWMNDSQICFSTFENNIVIGDSSTKLDLFIRNMSTSSTKRINADVSGNFQFTIPANTLHSTMFYNSRICLAALIENISGVDNTIGYDRQNVFIKWIDDEIIPLPSSEVYAYANDVINGNINQTHLDTYTSLDSIQGTPTLSVIGSAYVERVNSTQYKNDFTDVRWMSITYPVTFNDLPPMKIGFGIYQATPTLIDDFLDLKQNPLSPSNLNNVYGIAANITVDSQFNIVILSAGEDQYATCANTVYLEATIRGNTSGHTFLWELIEGTSTPPIVLTQTSQTQAFYFASPFTTDLKFRYWIDKGKVNQQYKDVIVYSTPVSISKQLQASTNFNKQINNPNLYISYLYTNINFDFNIAWNSAAEFPSTLAVEWGMPFIFYGTINESELLYIDYYHSSVLEKNVGIGWEEVVFKTENQIRQYYPLQENDIIRVGARYKKPGHEEYEVYYNPPEYLISNLLANNVLSQFKASSIINNTSVIRYSYGVLDGNTEATISPLVVSSNINTSSKQYISYDFLDSNDDTINQLEISSNRISFNLTRINGGNIGG